MIHNRKTKAKAKSKSKAKTKGEDDLVKVIGDLLLKKGALALGAMQAFDQAAKLAVSMGWSREGFVKFFSTTAGTFYDMHAAGEPPSKTTLERIARGPSPPAAPDGEADPKG